MNATLSVALFMYKQGFRWWSIGSAAAIAFVLFAVILGATLLQRRLQKGSEA
jgi:multiple sugar transport system permease protein